jgi:hypothetical protein
MLASPNSCGGYGNIEDLGPFYLRCAMSRDLLKYLSKSEEITIMKARLPLLDEPGIGRTCSLSSVHMESSGPVVAILGEVPKVVAKVFPHSKWHKDRAEVPGSSDPIGVVRLGSVEGSLLPRSTVTKIIPGSCINSATTISCSTPWLSSIILHFAAHTPS